jgi:rubrerythrin
MAMSRQQGADMEAIRMLKEGMAAEKMAARDYDILIEAATHQEEREWLMHIRSTEKRHYLLLEDIYRDLTGEDYPIPRPSASMPQYYCDMIKTSICDALEAAAFYERLIYQLSCLRHQEIVCAILNDEKEHARILAAIYQRCAY